VCSWLQAHILVEVTCEPDTKSTRPVELYRIRKVCGNVAVPPLELVHTRPARRRCGGSSWAAVVEIDQ